MNKLLIACCLACCGCAGLKPTPITIPDTSKHAEYEAALGFKGDKRGIRDIEAALVDYEGAWKLRAQAIRDNRYYANETSFVAAVATAIAGIRQSAEGILIGSGTLALSSAYASHFNFTVQAANYTNARKAMHCIRREINTVDMATWDILFDANGQYQLDTSEEAHRDVASTPSVAIQSIQDIVDKLDAAQDSVSLAVPDPSALRDSFNKYSTAQQGASVKADKARNNVTAKSTRVASMLAAAASAKTISDEMWKKLLLVPAAMRNCVALAGAGT